MVIDENEAEDSVMSRVLEAIEAFRQKELKTPPAIARLNAFVSRERERTLPTRDVEFGNVIP